MQFVAAIAALPAANTEAVVLLFANDQPVVEREISSRSAFCAFLLLSQVSGLDLLCAGTVLAIPPYVAAAAGSLELIEILLTHQCDCEVGPRSDGR